MVETYYKGKRLPKISHKPIKLRTLTMKIKMTLCVGTSDKPLRKEVEAFLAGKLREIGLEEDKYKKKFFKTGSCTGLKIQ